MKKSTFRDKLQQGIYVVINPVVKGLIKIGLTPNAVTTIGLILNIGVAIIFIVGAEKTNRGDLSYVGWAGALILFAGLFDMLDGQVARLGKMSSRFGALYDSVLDRYSELVLFLGICYYLVAHHYFLSSLFAFIALIGSMMVSYTRARAEGLGIECKGGLMQRPERVVLIALSALACGITSHYIGGGYKLYIPGIPFHVFETMSIFTVPITILAIMSNITAINRLRDAKQSLEKEQAAEERKNKPAGKQLIALVGIFIILLAGMHAKAGGPDRPKFPVPTGIPTMLFYLQRTPNSNTVVYDLNLKANGQLDEEEPVNIYWLRYTEGGAKKGLNFIQRKFAYGLKVKRLSAEKYEIKSVAYDGRPMYLMKSANGQYHMFMKINNTMAQLNNIWIQIEGGTFWVPNVVYVELNGTDPATGAEKTERFKP
jgi:phosphatidylglycerophosphate synthase